MNRSVKIIGRKPVPIIKVEPIHPEADELAILPEELELLDGVLDDVITEVVRRAKLKP